MLVAATFKGRFQPDVHDVQRAFDADHALPQGNHIRIIVLAAQARGLFIPAQCAANPADSIGDYRLAVARSSEHNAAFKFASGYSLGHWPDEERVIDWLFGVRAEIGDTVAKAFQKVSYLFFVLKAGVIRADGDDHPLPVFEMPAAVNLFLFWLDG